MTDLMGALGIFELGALLPLLFMAALALGGVILKFGEPVTTIDKPTKAAEAIKAGMLIVKDGATDTWAKVGASASLGVIIVADSHANVDKDTAIADGELVRGLVNPPGFLGILASGQNVAEHEALESAAGGELQTATTTQAVDEGGVLTYTITHSRIVGFAAAAVNATAAAKRITVITR